MNKVTTSTTLRYLCPSGVRQVYEVWLSGLRLALCCLWLLGGLLLAGSPAQAAEIKAGDILVVSPGSFPVVGVLFLVDPTTGNRTVLSDFDNPAQGRLGEPGSLNSVAVGRARRIFVTDQGGALFEVDPATGNRSVISDFGQGDIQGHPYYGLAVDASGKVLTNLGPLQPPLHFRLVRVDPKTDARALVSDLANPAQGETLSGYISDLALDHAGNILIGFEKSTDTESMPLGIVQVNPETGTRRLLSDFGNPAQGADALDLGFVDGLAVEASGQILVNSCPTMQSPRNRLMRIDPTTGNRAVLSDFDNSAQGDVGAQLRGIGVEKSGGIIVGSVKQGTSGGEDFFLARVNPTTGRRAVLTDSDNAAQGPSFSSIGYIAVVPAACVGDCGGTDTVAINDLITLVNIALGTAQLSACAHGVPSGAEVTIALIIQAVNNVLNGCGG